MNPGGRQRFRDAQRRIVLEQHTRQQRHVEVLHVSFATGIGINAKAHQTFVGSLRGI